MRRVVLAAGPDGRSVIAADEQLAEERRVVLWDTDTGALAPRLGAIDPATVAREIEPSAGPGGLRWVRTIIPSRSGAPAYGYTSKGMHTTRTVDCDYVLEGRLDLVADQGSVTVEAGDFVVIEGARHAWVNNEDRPAVLLVLLCAPVPASGPSYEPAAIGAPSPDDRTGTDGPG